MKFKIAGREHDLERADVYEALKGKHPRLVGQQRVFVKIRKQEWPIKQALAEVTGTDPALFPTSEPIRVFTALGFPISRTTKETTT